MKAESLRLENVEFVPATLEPGVLYVSVRFGTAIHLCACGCDTHTVTRLKPHWEDGWTLTEGPTLRPSVGNQNLPCKSHYYITNGLIEWL